MTLRPDKRLRLDAREHADGVTAAEWSALSEVIADYFGLHFPVSRRADLRRYLADAGPAIGCPDVAACVRLLLSRSITPEQADVLAQHLTVGETYFFRDPAMLQSLAADVLTPLVRERRGKVQRLRLWSAGGASGEEAYSLAILLHETLPDLAHWHITLLATDIDSARLRHAVAGVYGDWSFRGIPPAIRERYFTRREDRRWTIDAAIRRLVTFERLNLAEDTYPSLATNTNAMDIILCRNVLMYLTAAQIRRVTARLHAALVHNGCLIVSPTETSQEIFGAFAAVNTRGMTFYQKRDGRLASTSGAPPRSYEPVTSVTPASAPPEPFARPLAPARPSQPTLSAEALYAQGRYAEAVDAIVAASDDIRAPQALSLLVRSLANQGRLVEAFEWCDRWIETSKLEPGAYYLRAVVLLECGRSLEARQSLERAVYLAPAFVLAHFALANIARADGDEAQARRHFTNARRILARLPPETVLPESDGLTAARLADTITALVGNG